MYNKNYTRKNMYKLVAIDLDGTLLNSYGEVSEKNKKAIKKAMQNGKEIVIASGRPLQSAKSFALESGASNYVTCGNGSLLYDVKNDKILFDKFIDRQKVLEIIKICEENSIFYCLYTENLTISKALNYNILFYNNENKKMPEDKQTNIKIISDIYKYVEENSNIGILKITICDESSIIFGGIIKRLRQISDVDVLDVQHMARKVITSGTEDVKVEYHYTEITSKDVNKWLAIQDLANRLNIKSSEVIAIGDNMNDKEMIENAGLGVIMGNSAEYMHEFADGVAYILEKYL
mgnify:FL=1